MFENVDGRTDDGVTGILLAHPSAKKKQESNSVTIVPYKATRG